MIDTRVPGDPGAVQALGLWVRHRLLAATADATSLAVSARDRSVGEWDGEGAEAYRDHTSAVIGLSDAHCDRVAATADLVDAYAAHLADVQQHAAALRERAAAGGLHVDLTVVHAPDVAPMPTPVPPPGATPAGVAAHQRQVDAYATYAARRALYDDVVAEFCGVLAHHAAWVATYLTPRPEALEQETSGIGRIHSALASTPAGLFVVSAAEGLQVGLFRRAVGLGAELAELRSLARSGDPARRASATDPEVRERRAALPGELERTRVAMRFLGPLGLAYDVYADYVAISDGASPGETTFETLSGIGGAAALVTLAGVVVVGAPAWLAVGVVATAGAAGAYLGSFGASYVWDRFPDALTEAVDEGLHDAWQWFEEAVS